MRHYMGAVGIEDTTLVKDMLRKITELGEGISYRINNTYSNGIDNTVLEIKIFESAKQTGRIAYQLEDGHVINYRYKDLEKRLPIQIMDMLLDVISYEVELRSAR